MGLVKEIIDILTFDGSLSPHQKKEIFEKMQEIQELGPPPNVVAKYISVRLILLILAEHWSKHERMYGDVS